MSNAAGWLFGVALFFWPRPSLAALLIAAIAPVLAITVAAVMREDISLADVKGEARANLGIVLILPALMLGARALLDYDMLDWRPALIVACLLSIVLTFAAVAADPERFGNPFMILFAVLVGLAWGWGLLISANTATRQTSPEAFSTTIIAKHEIHGRGTRYEVDVKPWGRGGPTTDIGVDFDTFQQASIGDRLCLGVFTGRLGWRWYDPIPCQETLSPT